MHFSEELIIETEDIAFEEGVRLDQQNKGVEGKLSRFFKFVMPIFLCFILIVRDIIDDKNEY
jgi:hypothetical protein